MLLEIAKPKNAVNLFAGVVGIAFEKVGVVGAASNGSAVHEPDDLTEIKGIGKTFAQRLNSAGIFTFDDLAEQSPEYIRLVARVETWQGDPVEWIAEAKTRL